MVCSQANDHNLNSTELTEILNEQLLPDYCAFTAERLKVPFNQDISRKDAFSSTATGGCVVIDYPNPRQFRVDSLKVRKCIKLPKDTDIIDAKSGNILRCFIETTFCVGKGDDCRKPTRKGDLFYDTAKNSIVAARLFDNAMYRRIDKLTDYEHDKISAKKESDPAYQALVAASKAGRSATAEELRAYYVPVCEAQTHRTWRTEPQACVSAGNAFLKKTTLEINSGGFFRYYQIQKALQYFSKGCEFGIEAACSQRSQYEPTISNSRKELRKALNYLIHNFGENSVYVLAENDSFLKRFINEFYK